MTVNGISTCTLEAATLQQRGLGAVEYPDADVNEPPYAIHNGARPCSVLLSNS